MWRVVLFGVSSVAFLALGVLQPGAVLLDVPFGLAFSLADIYGLWRPGPLWVSEYRLLALFCFFVFPLIVSTTLGYATTFIMVRLWGEGQKYSRLFAVCFIVAVLALILAARVEPGSVKGSYYGYWVENY